MALTQTELVVSDSFSSKICSVCDSQLTEFCSMRDAMIGIQETLLAFENQRQASLEPEAEVFEYSTDHSYIVIVSSGDDLKARHTTKSDQTGRRPVQRPGTSALDLDSFHCDLCGLSSSSRAYFGRHMKRHASGSVSGGNTCRICCKAFANESLLDQHRSKAHKAKVHLCDSCGIGFNGPSALEIHRKVQHSKWELPCHYCSKLFASQKHLNRHLKHHEGFKFVCDFEGCDKEFISNALLNEHSKTHSDIKNFHCAHCTKSFCLKRQLRKHEKGVHSTKRFACGLCAYSNGRRDNLRQHYFRSHNLTKGEIDGILSKLE